MRYLLNIFSLVTALAIIASSYGAYASKLCCCANSGEINKAASQSVEKSSMPCHNKQDNQKIVTDSNENNKSQEKEKCCDTANCNCSLSGITTPNIDHKSLYITEVIFHTTRISFFTSSKNLSSISQSRLYSPPWKEILA